MQASTFAVKGSVGFDTRNRRFLPGFGEFRKRNSSSNNLYIPEKASSFAMRLPLRTSVQSECRPMAKARSVKAQASAGLFLVLDFLAWVLSSLFELNDFLFVHFLTNIGSCMLDFVISYCCSYRSLVWYAYRCHNF